MPTKCLPHCALLFESGDGLRMFRGGQLMTWVRSMKALTNGLVRVVGPKPADWGPRDPLRQWLETKGDMA